MHAHPIGTAPLFPSAFDRLDCEKVTAADIVDFHKSVFGDLRMSNDDGAVGGGDDGGGGGDGSGGTGTGSGDGGGSGDAGRGFPADTPVKDMTVEEQAAYWKHQARKHETRSNSRSDYDEIKADRDRLKQAAETDSEKAIREAREAGKAEAKTAANEATVAAMLRMGLRARGITDAAELDELVDTVKLSAHADAKGVVDDEKVLRTLNRLAGSSGSGGSGPDTGQGRRGSGTQQSKADAGRAEAKKRFGDKANAATA